MNLVETAWLVRYPLPVEITYYQGGEYLGHEYTSSFIKQEYGIKIKPASSENPQVNTTTEIIHQVLGNLVRNLHIIYNKHMEIMLTRGWAS